MFDTLTKLEDLHLHLNRLTSPLQPNIFDRLTHLIYLDLSHNNLDFIRSDTLRPLRRLKHLFLGHNKISELDEDMFENMSFLVELSLQHNRIDREQDLPRGIFRNLLNLCEFKFTGNGLAQMANFKEIYFQNRANDKSLHIYLIEHH